MIKLPACLLLVILFAVPMVRIIFPLLQWESTDAVVTRTRIGWEANPSGNGGKWTVTVTYGYDVKGKRYQSSLYNEHGVFKTWFKVRAARFAEGYPTGEVITAYFDPGNPAIAVLNPFGSWLLTIVLFIPLVVLASWMLIKTSKYNPSSTTAAAA